MSHGTYRYWVHFSFQVSQVFILLFVCIGFSIQYNHKATIYRVGQKLWPTRSSLLWHFWYTSGILHSTSCLVSHILSTPLYQAVNILYVHEKIRWSDDLIRWWDLITWHAFNPMGTSLSTVMRCPTAISRNDPITLANEIHKLVNNSCSDWPFHVIFTGNDL